MIVKKFFNIFLGMALAGAFQAGFAQEENAPTVEVLNGVDIADIGPMDSITATVVKPFYCTVVLKGVDSDFPVAAKDVKALEALAVTVDRAPALGQMVWEVIGYSAAQAKMSIKRSVMRLISILGQNGVLSKSIKVDVADCHPTPP